MSTDELDQLLRKTQKEPSTPLLPDELSYLITSFVPSQPAALRSKAYLVLSAFCQGVRQSSSVKGKQPDPATETLYEIFEPAVVSRLADSDDSRIQEGLSFLTALFQVDGETGSRIFGQDGILDFMMDSVDLKPSRELALLVAHLLSQACGIKRCRALITAPTVEWLEEQSKNSDDPSLRAAVSVSLVKLSRGRISDAAASGVTETQEQPQDEDQLADVMKSLVINSDDKSSISDAVEGLAYLSVDPTVKDALSRDPVFLKHFFSLIPHRKAQSLPAEPNTTLLYGVLLTIANICAYRPRLTEEQAQIAKLKRMANTAKKPSEPTDASSSLDDDDIVKERISRLVSAGVLEVFAGAVPGTDSIGIRSVAGKALLSIVEDRENRGKVLQNGGAKLLGIIIKKALDSSPPDSKAKLELADLEPIQALAKLAITSSPVQVFGPNDGAIYDAIRPFSLMLQHPSSTLLQKFEALMALTNLSSHSAETSSRIATAEGLLNAVELLLLEEHPLVRRASMELICNLISGSDVVYERYGGTENNTSTRAKLQIVLAMSDVEDLNTRLAASGALATITDSPSACAGLVDLQLERHRMLLILAQLVDPTACPENDDDGERSMDTAPGLVHRGIVCVRNIMLNTSDAAKREQLAQEASEAGLVQGLVNVVKSNPTPAILQPAVEALKCIMDTLKK